MTSIPKNPYLFIKNYAILNLGDKLCLSKIDTGESVMIEIEPIDAIFPHETSFVMFSVSNNIYELKTNAENLLSYDINNITDKITSYLETTKDMITHKFYYKSDRLGVLLLQQTRLYSQKD